MPQIAERAHTAHEHEARFMIKTGERVNYVAADEINWIEAAGNYLRLHGINGRHLLRETMKGIEAQLDRAKFQRIQRSAIVNITRIQRLEPWTRGEVVVILQDGTRLTTAGGYGRQLRDILGPSLSARSSA